MLVDGTWTKDWQPVQGTDEKGGFVRQVSGFRAWVTPDGAPGPTGEGGFPAQAGRYHLYVGYICPWASRALMARKLKGLEEAISVSVVEPALTDQGWRFGDYPGADRDTLNGATYMHELYSRADPHYTGRATIPVLWDKARGTIVNNESADIVRMFNSGFGDLLARRYARSLPVRSSSAEIDELNAAIYPAPQQRRLSRRLRDDAGSPMTKPSADVFTMLDTAGGPAFAGRAARSCCGAAPDRGGYPPVRDAGALRCRLSRAVQVQSSPPRRLCRAVSALSGAQVLERARHVRETVSIDHIKRGYYSIKALNPTGVVPVGPDLPGLDPVG